MPSKWIRDAQAKHHNEHMDRIKNMQPVVDNKKPRELPMSGKKEIERRQFRNKIEKGNRLLLDRLGKALERKNIDNERKAIKFNSLEQGKKKLELKRVTMENQLLLNRIQFAQPMYNHHQWERDAEHRYVCLCSCVYVCFSLSLFAFSINTLTHSLTHSLLPTPLTNNTENSTSRT